MGIFTDDVFVFQFPIVLPKFCFLIHGRAAEGVQNITVDAIFRYTSMPPVVLAKNQVLKFLPTRRGFSMNLVISPFAIESAGDASLELNFGGTKHHFKFKVAQVNQQLLDTSFAQSQIGSLVQSAVKKGLPTKQS